MTVQSQDGLADMTDEADQGAKKRQRMRSIAIAATLFFLVACFYAATIIRIGGRVFEIAR